MEIFALFFYVFRPTCFWLGVLFNKCSLWNTEVVWHCGRIALIVWQNTPSVSSPGNERRTNPAASGSAEVCEIKEDTNLDNSWAGDLSILGNRLKECVCECV